MTNELIAEIDRNITQAKKHIELGNAMDRLMSNRDFKKVILEGFFEQEAIRLVHVKADPALQTPERQASILQQMDGIGVFAQYLRTVEHQANLARKSIEDAEIERDELLAEED